MPIDEKVIELLKFIATNSECESMFLSPDRDWIIYSNVLITEVVKIWKLNREEVSKIIAPEEAYSED